MKKTYLFTRKIDKQEYKFYHMDFTADESWIDREYGCFMVETPENAFGYPDYVYFDDDKESTMHRTLAPWKLRKLREILVKRGFDPDSRDYMKF